MKRGAKPFAFLGMLATNINTGIKSGKIQNGLGKIVSQTGAPGRNRTADLRFTKPLLYQLSYKGTALRLAYLSRQ